MALRLYDSLTRQIRELTAGQPDGVFRFYNCGLTVYAPGHIGNFRTFVINDVLRRVLERQFGSGKVRHVRNLTDVDDRTIEQSRREGKPLGEITRKWTDVFHADSRALNCLPPHVEPTATGHIAEQVDMIEVLLRKGNAYRAPDGSVYFRIASFPRYGALSHIQERELKATNTVFDSDHKDDLSDFALWKAYKPEEDGDVRWPGPAAGAVGRPGWHIECSAMIRKHLGETIDLHTGGVDLLFPHHENEIAQSECCNGKTFVRHWFHSEHLLVDNAKMSKSKGNYYTLSDLTAKGYSPMAVRYALMAGHPRKQLNFTMDSLHAAESALRSLRQYRDTLSGIVPTQPLPTEGEHVPEAKGPFDVVRQDLEDDLNLPKALGDLFAAVKQVSAGILAPDEARKILRSFDAALWLLGLELGQVAVGAPTGGSGIPENAPPEVVGLAERRWAAKKAKNFAGADALRAELAAAGWSMLDGKDGYRLERTRR